MGQVERGLYRVHHFTKIEMFVVCANDSEVSNRVHEEILKIQQSLFDGLDLHYRVLDMHPGKAMKSSPLLGPFWDLEFGDFLC
jgi:seryl-tRNA synthetase